MKSKSFIYKTFESYLSSEERQDQILDKISKSGIESLSKSELEFLNSFSSGREDEINSKIDKEELGDFDYSNPKEWTYTDDELGYKFEFASKKDYGNEIRYSGSLTLPDLDSEGKLVSGKFESGCIVLNKESGMISLDFGDKDGLEPYDFVGENHYELESFIENTIAEIDEKY